MTLRSRIPAAAPAWAGSLIGAPERDARIVHRGADAVYLDVDGWCLGILSAAATAVPCSLRTGLPRLTADLLDSERARVGAGRVALDHIDVVVARTVEATVPRIDPRRIPGAGADLTRAAGDRLDAVRAELPGDALAYLADGRPEAVPALLGRGSGLTPVGDDVLAGWIATRVATSAVHDGDSAVMAAVARHAHERTTLLSATLLDCARRGDVLPQFRRLLLDLADRSGAGVDDSVDGLLRVGHTSGAGLMLGTVLALRHLASRSPS